MAEKEIVIDQEDIAARVRELGRRISADYLDGSLLVIGVLNGAFIFMADLVRQISVPLELDFIRVASYGYSSSSTGNFRFTKDVELELSGKDVLLVEDIVDTGHTLAYLKELFIDRKALSVRICALIDKKERREVPVAVDYVGFDVAEGFLVGYGLDCKEQHRHYQSVYRLLNP